MRWIRFVPVATASVIALPATMASAQTAPKLNLSTLTAQDGGTTLTATPIDAETGSGF